MVDNIYSPLPPKSHAIRLIDLQPGAWDDPIECELRETPIEKASNRYTSISYTWGTIETTRQLFIVCNERQVPISGNLYTILRRLRRPDFSILVWADALCINQHDASERTHQVGLMGEIYKNSKETVIWLGEQTDQDDVGERLLERCVTPRNKQQQLWGGPPHIAWLGMKQDEVLLSTYLREYMQLKGEARTKPNDFARTAQNMPVNDVFGAFCLIYSLSRGTSSLAIEFLEDNYVSRMKGSTAASVLCDWQWTSRSSRVWAGLQRLMSRPWWTRVWVVQETVLARKATVHFGMLSMPWSMFAAAAAQYELEQHRLCLDLSGTLDGHEHLSRFSSSVMRIDNTRLHHQAKVDDVTLLSLLWKFRSLEASDKRDKVFALLGLTTHWQGFPAMLPDYQMDAGSTFTGTAVGTITRSKSLSVLAGDLDAGLGRKRLKGIPSWVMDWSLPCLAPEIDRVNSLSMYNACAGLNGTIRLHELHSILEVEGAYIDDVVTVGDISRHTQISDTLAIVRQWKWLYLKKEADSRLPGYPTGGSYDDAFWRTLLGDLVHASHITFSVKSDNANTYERATEEDYACFEAWRMWSRCISRDTYGRTATFSQRDLDEGISSIHYALKTATASRRFFLTRSGFMGIGPRSTQPGDRVYVLKGSRVPFLVRPDSLRSCSWMPWRTIVVGDGENGGATTGPCDQQHSCHRLVGDVYVHGLMDGKAMQKGAFHQRKIFLV